MDTHQRDYEYLLRGVKRGGHYHCRLFSRKIGRGTWEGCGSLVFREEEWVSAKLALAHVSIDLMGEEDGTEEG